MIIIGEPDKKIRKRLCDLLFRERIIGVDSVQEILNALCKFRTKVDLIMITVNFVSDLVPNEVTAKLCHKLQVQEPPVLGYYKKGEEGIMEHLKTTCYGINLIKYDEADKEFPVSYLAFVKKLCPQVYTDVEKAKEIWLKPEQTPDVVDLAGWMEEEGLEELADKKGPLDCTENVEYIMPSIKYILDEQEQRTKDREEAGGEDYEQKYFALRKKYDELMKFVKGLPGITIKTNKQET